MKKINNLEAAASLLQLAALAIFFVAVIMHVSNEQGACIVGLLAVPLAIGAAICDRKALELFTKKIDDGFEIED